MEHQYSRGSHWNRRCTFPSWKILDCVNVGTWVWSVNVVVHRASRKPQILTAASPGEVARSVPLNVHNINPFQIRICKYYFGWKWQSETHSLWPSPLMMRSPLGTDHIFQVQSSDTVAMISFLGWRVSLKIPFMTSGGKPRLVFFRIKTVFIIGQNCLNRTFSSAFLVLTKFRSCIHVLLTFYRFRKLNEYMYRMSNIRFIFL